ncbi:MAG: phage portal protein [Micromonosporaceae bacterium]|nr:phage portal protein [Micromonosporaceae bacterium]
MSRRIGIRRPLRPRRPVTKAALPGGVQLPSGAQTTDLTPTVAALQQRTQIQGYAGMSTPLPREMSDFIAAFGPGVPLYPEPLQPARPDTGQPDPRRWAYPVSWNLSREMQRHTPWSLLLETADRVDLVRRCIEIRKAEHVSQDWDFTLSRRALEAAGANTPGEKSALRDKYSDQIARLVEWWQVPDKTNGLNFSTWLTMALEEHFVLDALAIYPRVTYGGDLASLEILDGSTIKPLLDTRGNRPAPPAPAFQQWLYGFPRGEYTFQSDSDTWQGTAGELIYAVRNARTRSPYGYSAVEQALMSADLWLHREQWMRAEYTVGTLPTTWLQTDAAAGSLTPEQIRAWETTLNDFYSGSTDNRHRLRLLPGGINPIDTQDAGERYKPEYDEFLVKLICAHFDVDPMELGFSPRSGLGGKGFSEGQTDSKYRKAIKPLNEWLVDLINDISRRYLGMPPELTFQFLGGEAEDEKAEDDIADVRVKGGRMTFNEDRDRMGLPRYDAEWADKPMMLTASGPMWLDQAWEEATAPPAPVPAPLAGHVPAAPPPGGQPPAEPKPAEQPEQPEQDGQDEAKKAELAAYRRWVRKGKRSRPFQWHHHSDAEVAELTKAGDARGRGEAPAGRAGPAGSRPGGEQAPGGYRAGFDWARAEPDGAR